MDQLHRNSIVNLVNGLIDHYSINRGVGHTSLVINGVRSFVKMGAVVIAANVRSKNYIARTFGISFNNILTISEIGIYAKLCGKCSPITIDNEALLEILYEFRTLNRENLELKEQIAKLKED